MYLCIYIATHLHMVDLDWLQAVLESNSRCAWKWRSSALRDTLWGRDQANLEMHWEAMINGVWWCTWRPWSNKLDMHLLAGIGWTPRWTLRLWPSEIGDAPAGYDRVRLEKYLEVVNLEAVDGRCARCWDSIHRLVKVETVGMWRGDLTFEALVENRLVAVDR